MSLSPRETLHKWSVWKRHMAVCGVVALIVAAAVTMLYLQDRQREWGLRTLQTQHRLDDARALIARELSRVRSDALYLADQEHVRRFVAGEERFRTQLEYAYRNFMRRQATYDQIRLLNMAGAEIIRVEYGDGRATATPQTELQDKEHRYYYRDSLSLRGGEVFVSEFDLNMEHGAFERPLKPVIRLVTPVVDGNGENRALLVLNYMGDRLLAELDHSSLPGFTMLLKPDGHYVRGPLPEDAWGWLLAHERTFARQFPLEWKRITTDWGQCILTSKGAFAASRISLGRFASVATASSAAQSADDRNTIIVVSCLPRGQVFLLSSKLLRRLLLLAGCMIVPLAILARYWATASVGRQLQSRRIAASEERLRELSSRLLRIQEDERRAISREIHDELGQQVTAINLDLKLADRNLETGGARPHLARAIHENEQLLQTLHAFATRVRPAVLDDLGLFDAMESHLWEFNQRTGITVDSCLAFSSSEIPDVVADNAYRLLQESLNNVARHANARQVRVEVRLEANGGARNLRMTVTDDGRGCQATDFSGPRLGFVGMQERVDLLGGDLQITSQGHRGTRVEVRLPLSRVNGSGTPPTGDLP